VQYLHFGEQDVTWSFTESPLGLSPYRIRFPFNKSMMILHRMSLCGMTFSDVEYKQK